MSIGDLAIWGLLISGSVCDIRRKKLPVLLLAAAGAAGCVLTIMGNQEAVEWAYSVMPGMALLLLAFVTREKIGYGDGVTVLAMGLLEGGRNCLFDLGIGLCIVSVCGLFLLVLKKADRNSQIPFVPFLLIAHGLRCVLGV